MTLVSNELSGFEPAVARKAYGLVFVLSGPSGVGKDTVRQRLIDEAFPLGYCVTLTTRAPRAKRPAERRREIGRAACRERG
jgi:hypothetical protein